MELTPLTTGLYPLQPPPRCPPAPIKGRGPPLAFTAPFTPLSRALSRSTLPSCRARAAAALRLHRATSPPPLVLRWAPLWIHLITLFLSGLRRRAWSPAVPSVPWAVEAPPRLLSALPTDTMDPSTPPGLCAVDLVHGISRWKINLGIP
jgi:hypothetical protein